MKVNLTQEEVNSILGQDSEMLVVTIVAYRVLGSFAEEAKVAMYELLRRKIEEKSDFDFENRIAEAVKESKIELKVPKLQDFKRTFFNGMIQAMLENKGDISVDEDRDDEPEEKQQPPMDPRQEKDMLEVYNELKHILNAEE